MRPANPPLALIAGPTSSGKSALALALAERTGGVIVNADSAQVYRDLPVLSAAPSAEEFARVEHRLYGYRDGSEPCSAADWALQARREISDIQSKRQLPILVGGTGLYLRTLLEGIAPVPEINLKVRQQVRDAPVEENRERLIKLDPEGAARLKAGDKARIARTLEVVVSTGRTLAEWQRQREGGIGKEVQLRPLVLLPPREWLYARCDLRFARMVEQGAVEEVKTLLARKLDPELPVMRAIGMRELGAWLAAELTFEQALTAGQQATRRYAKRQYTWFTHQLPAQWPRFHDELDSTAMARALELF